LSGWLRFNTNQAGPAESSAALLRREEHHAVRVRDLDPLDVAFLEQRSAIEATAVLLPAARAGASEAPVILLKESARASRSASSFCSTVAWVSWLMSAVSTRCS
jgi:hypothetical protein